MTINVKQLVQSGSAFCNSSGDRDETGLHRRALENGLSGISFQQNFILSVFIVTQYKIKSKTIEWIESRNCDIMDSK